MARLSPAAWAALAFVGVFAAVALLPGSAWVPRAQLDVVQKGFTVPDFVDQYPSGYLEGINLDLTKRDDSLARAFIAFRHRSTRPGKDAFTDYLAQPRFALFEDHLERFPTDVRAYAHYIRLLSQAPMARDPRPKVAPSKESEDQKRRTAQKVLALATRGANLEEENAYFPMMAAAALQVLGRESDSRNMFQAAAQLRRFNDYPQDEAEVLIKILERHVGYRGEKSRAVAWASIVLPHYASLRRQVVLQKDAAPKDQRLAVQWTLFRVFHLIARDSPSLIGMLVGKSGMDWVVADPEALRGLDPDERREFVEGRVRSFASELSKSRMLDAGQDPLGMLEEAQKLADLATKPPTTDDGIDTDNNFFETIFRWSLLGGYVLVGFVGLLLAWALERLWGRIPAEQLDRSRFAWAAGFLGLNLAVLLSTHEPIAQNPIPLAFVLVAGLFFVLAVKLGKGQSTAVLSVALVVLAFALPALVRPLGGLVIGSLTLMLVLLVNYAPRLWPLAILSGVLAALVGALVIVDKDVSRLGLLYPIPAALFWLAVLLTFSSRWRPVATASSLAALGVAYLVMVSLDVRQNAEVRQVNARFLSAADDARAKAQLPRLSQDPEAAGAERRRES